MLAGGAATALTAAAARAWKGAMTNLIRPLERAAADHPDHPAIRLDDLVLTYAQLREAARRMSTLLASRRG